MNESSPQKRTAAVTGSAGGRCPASPSSASSLVTRMTDLLALHIKTGHTTNPLEYSNHCLALARGIDEAVTNNEVPSRARDLPLVLKQVYKRKNDSLQAAVMVLMTSVKYACKIGWFSDKDTDDLLVLANEIGKYFISMSDTNVEPSYGPSYISEIMSRFYPQIKMGHILSSLKTKPGYGAFVADFHMPKSMMSSAQEQIYLFVAQTDNLDTSSCIVTPQQVNFLINGKGVKGRINSSLDKGPQHPTNVTAMLKCGINLLQVVGQFNGHYIVVIALMSLISSSETPVLQDYVQPVVAALDTDFEIKVGLLRISLNCPISCRLIRTPVKGRLCKHLQCFDYENFMEINSRKPSWRCPLCDQSVCYPDIRIDQNIVKILKEVGENIAEVIVSTDGSWKAVLESEDHKDGQGQRWQQEGSDQCESIEFSRIPADVIDLAMGGDSDACGLSIFGREKKNPFLDNLEGYFTSGNLVAPEVNDTFRVDQNASAQMEDDFWSGIMFASTSAPQHLTAPATNSDSRTDAGISYTPPFNFMHSRVLADAVSPAPSRESVDSREETHFTLSLPQNQLFDPSSLRNVSPTPSAIQSISAQAQGPSSCQQIRALNSSVPSVASSPTPQSTHSMALNTVGFAAVNGGTESDQQLSRLLMNSVPVSNVASSSTQHHSVTQSGVEHDRRLVSGKSAQQVIAGLPVQSPDAHSRPSRFPSLLQNPNHSIPSNWRTSNTMTQSQNVVHPSIHVQSVQIQQKCGGVQATGAVTNKQPMLRAAAQQTAQVSRSPPSVPVQLQASRTGTAFSIGMVAERLKTTGEQRQTSGGTTQPISRPDGSSTLASTHNWRPTGRMRGSLTGEAYSAALSQFMIQPTQPAAQDSQSPSNLTSNLRGALHISGLIVNSTNAYNNSQAQIHLRSGDAANQPENSGSFPECSLGMP